MKDIRKVVIPVAGWGTRSLPATKNIPKEMLPIYNKPVIQYVVEEAQRAHIKDVIFVTNRDKNVIEDHFDHNLQLEDLLERSGKLDKLEEVRRVAEMVNILSVRQKRQLGLGHAVLCARELVGDEPFAVMVGDDLMFSGVPGIGRFVDNLCQGRRIPWRSAAAGGNGIQVVAIFDMQMFTDHRYQRRLGHGTIQPAANIAQRHAADPGPELS